MILTFVFVERNAVTVAVKLNKMCVNVNKGSGYVYCKYEDYIRCDGTVVRYILPLCLLIETMNKHLRLDSVIM